MMNLEYSLHNFTHDVKILVEQIKEVAKNKYATLYPVVRGGVPVALQLSNLLDIPVVNLNSESFPVGETLIVDDIVDSGKTRMQYENFDFAALHVKDTTPKNCLPTYWVREETQYVDYWWEEKEKPGEPEIIRLLEMIGEDPTREGLRETPARVIKAFKHWFSGYGKDPEKIFKQFSDGGEDYDQIILVKDIPVYSHCEHHMSPFFGVAHVGYIPDKKIVGLSKISRAIEIFSRRLQVQERLTNQIAALIQTQLKPQGVAVVLECRHLCMESRGIEKQGSTTTTSAMHGVFMNKPEARAEFFSLIK